MPASDLEKEPNLGDEDVRQPALSSPKFGSQFWFALFFIAGAGVTLFAGLFVNFHVAGNDFWSPLYYGRHMTWDQKESLYNGFYPVGYAFLIGQFPYSYAVQLSYILNALLAGLFIASVAGLVSSTRSIPVILLTFFISTAMPVVFEYANTVGPDIGSAAFTAFAVYLLWVDQLAGRDEGFSASKAVLIGSSLGLAVLWRNHAIVSSLVILAVYLLVAMILVPVSKIPNQPSLRARQSNLLVSEPRKLVRRLLRRGSQTTGAGERPPRNDDKMFLRRVVEKQDKHPLEYFLTIVGFLLGIFSLQVLANVMSGHGLFETTQNFNIYKLFYGVDWTNPPSPAEIEKFSLLEPLRENPQEFFGAMLPWFRFLASFAWPGIVCVLLARWKSVVSKFGLFSALTIIFYAIPLALGDSLRAQLTTMSLFLSSLGIGFSIFVEQIRKLSGSKGWLPNLAMALILLGGGYQILRWVPLDLGFLRRNRSEHRNFIKAEQSLLAHGMDSPDQVFADRLDFYLPNLPPYLPRQIEGFFYDWVWGYNLEYSPLPNDSWESFVQASHAQGIQYLVLSPNSAYRGDFFPPIYNEETDLNEAGLQFIAQIGRQRLYRLR